MERQDVSRELTGSVGGRLRPSAVHLVDPVTLRRPNVPVRVDHEIRDTSPDIVDPVSSTSYSRKHLPPSTTVWSSDFHPLYSGGRWDLGNTVALARRDPLEEPVVPSSVVPTTPSMPCRPRRWCPSRTGWPVHRCLGVSSPIGVHRAHLEARISSRSTPKLLACTALNWIYRVRIAHSRPLR